MSYRQLAPGQPQVTHETILALFVETVFLPACKAAGFTGVVYEDGVHDPVDYSKHVNPRAAGYQLTWHSVSAVWFGRSVAFAADLNADNAPSGEHDFMARKIIPIAKLWGLGYHWENNHLHIDVGQYSNDGRGWYRGGWEGRPDYSRSHIITVDGAWGYNTTRSLQRMLKIREDGDFGPASRKAWQSWLKARKLYRGPIDGDLGPASQAASQHALGTAQPWGSAWFNLSLQLHLNATHAKGTGALK